MRGDGVNPSRPRLTIAGRVYEKFKPIYEWRREDDHDTLLVYLPGFRKELLKVTTEHPNILRVRGERLVTGNKWNRFHEDFKVSKAFKMSGIRAKFDGGILTITIPRKTINPTTSTSTTTHKPDEPKKTTKQDTNVIKHTYVTLPPLDNFTKPDHEIKTDNKTPLINEKSVKTKTGFEHKRVAKTSFAVMVVVAIGILCFLQRWNKK